MSDTPSKTGNMTPSMKFELERREARSFRPDAEVVTRGTAITLHSTVMAMRAELATLRERLAAAEALAERNREDAERYRWLRDPKRNQQGKEGKDMIFAASFPYAHNITQFYSPEGLDAAIDAARGEAMKPADEDAFMAWWECLFGDEDFKDCRNECAMAWKAAVAAERERWAKWHDERAKMCENSRYYLLQRGRGDDGNALLRMQVEHEQSAAAIREGEKP